MATRVAARYLSPASQLVDRGCPLRLLPEVARATEASRQAFREILNDDRHIAARRPDEAFALLALLVGGITLARGVADEALGDRILAACRKQAEALLEPSSPKSAPRSRRSQGEPKP